MLHIWFSICLVSIDRQTNDNFKFIPIEANLGILLFYGSCSAFALSTQNQMENWWKGLGCIEVSITKIFSLIFLQTSSTPIDLIGIFHLGFHTMAFEYAPIDSLDARTSTNIVFAFAKPRAYKHHIDNHKQSEHRAQVHGVKCQWCCYCADQAGSGEKVSAQWNRKPHDANAYAAAAGQTTQMDIRNCRPVTLTLNCGRWVILRRNTKRLRLLVMLSRHGVDVAHNLSNQKCKLSGAKSIICLHYRSFDDR